MSDAAAHAALDAALRKRGVYARAREVLRAYAAAQLGGAPALPDALPSDVFDALAQAGLVDTLLAAAREEGISLDAATFELLRRGGGGGGGGGASPPAGAAPEGADAAARSGAGDDDAPLDPNRRYLRVSLGRGRAFLAHLEPGYSWGLEDEEEEDAEANADAAAASAPAPALERFYVLHLTVAGQRFSSAPARAGVEPAFDGSAARGGARAPGFGDFLVDVTPGDGAALPSLDALLAAGARDGAAAVHATLVLVSRRAAPGAGAGAAAAAAANDGAGAAVRADIVGSASFDWRGALAEPDGELRVLLPLLPPGPPPGPAPAAAAAGAGAGAGAPDAAAAAARDGTAVGLLPLTVALVPAPGGGALPRAAVARALADEAARAGDAGAAFLAYAKAWWSEYRALHASFRRRLVRIFGEGGEAGGRFVPLVSRVVPLAADRVLESPAAAARFVSLLPVRRGDPEAAVGGPAHGGPAWRAPHAVLAARAGSPQDLALLLASLLLGFGLDAYVVVGTREAPGGGEGGGAGGAGAAEGAAPAEEEHAWVMTRYPAPGGGFRALFWEPETGARCEAPAAPGEAARVAARCPYVRVACAFSGDRFFAVQSGDDSVGYVAARVGWAFEDALGAGWKGMEPALLAALPHSPAPPLAPPSLRGADLAAPLEAALLRALAAHRAAPPARAALARARAALAHAAGAPALDAGAAPGALAAHATPTSPRLAALLGQALAAYEADRVAGVPAGEGASPDACRALDDFAVAIKRAVPRGAAFRGFPISFNHASPSRIWDTLLAARAARDIIEVCGRGGGRARVARGAGPDCAPSSFPPHRRRRRTRRPPTRPLRCASTSPFIPRTRSPCG
jgi:hypothetical protein